MALKTMDVTSWTIQYRTISMDMKAIRCNWHNQILELDTADYWTTVLDTSALYDCEGTIKYSINTPSSVPGT